MRKYRNQSLSCGNFVKKPSAFRPDVNLETDNPTRIIHLLARLEDVLTGELASDEFCSIIRLSTGFIQQTNHPSETDNPPRRIIRL